jgi:molybdopterin/thiamine biosynthesis adenylyltransferase/proteasome lid subunit RPN8/RPN11
VVDQQPLTAPIRELRIADHVVDTIRLTVGAHPVETGGALLGYPDERIVTDFLFDPNARTGYAVYQNSLRLIERIGAAEAATPQRFVGILHSHPADVARPSGQDVSEFTTMLSANPGLPFTVSPIVTFDLRAAIAPHEVVVDGMRMSCFVSTRTTDGVRVDPVVPVVLPVRASLHRVDPDHAPIVTARLEGVPVFMSEVVHGGRRLVVSMPLGFPTAAATIVDEDGRPLRIAWRLDSAPEERLALALEDAARSARAEADGPTGADPEVPRATRKGVPLGALTARASGMLSDRIHRRSALIVGAGSMGSDIAEALVRSGVGRITLMDPDIVEAHNLGRARYSGADIGQSKVHALARHMAAISTELLIEAVSEGTADVDRDRLAGLVSSADVVVAATDDPEAQSLLNHVARHVGTPAVFVGMYARAEGGEIVVSRSDVPCFACATGRVRDLRTDDTRRTADYGTGRLVAEPGLASDVQFVSAAAAKIVLGLLEEDADADARVFVEQPLSHGQSYIVFSMRPDYWVFPSAMRDAAAQYAMQSLWMRVERRDDCPVCGAAPEDPLVFRAPRLARLREFLAARRRAR